MPTVLSEVNRIGRLSMLEIHNKRGPHEAALSGNRALVEIQELPMAPGDN